MQYPLDIPGFENRQLIMETRGFTAGPKLMIDGEPAPKGPKPGQFILRRLDGTETLAQLKTTNFVDPVPQLVVDGKTFSVAPPLKWYQWLWGGLPFLLVLIGGLLGGIFGGVALVLNGRIFRAELNGLAKYILTGMVSILAIIGFFISASLFNLSVRNFFPPASQQFTSDAGNFTIQTPYTLTENVQSVDTPVGKIEFHFFSADKGNQSYLVGYSDYPPEAVNASTPDRMLNGSRDGVVNNLNGTLVSETQIALDSYPGRELVINAKIENGQAVVVRSRIFLVENRLYQIMTIVVAGQENNRQIDEFLQSFKLLHK